MNDVLEIQFSGWTATPRLPFVLSGNAICLPTPTYSLLLGIIGCCLGRCVDASEIKVGFYYTYDTTAKDLETRQRLEFDGKRIKKHAKGSDAYEREFHIAPRLTVWVDRLDWEQYFLSPVGTPALGRSQDILKIESVRRVAITKVNSAIISGSILPFNVNLQIGGQLVQLAEAYRESGEIGGGRTALRNKMFISVHYDNKALVTFPNLYQTNDDLPVSFYMHDFADDESFL